MRHFLAAISTWGPLLTAARLIPSVQQDEGVSSSVPDHRTSRYLYPRRTNPVLIYITDLIDDAITLVIPWTAPGADDLLVSSPWPRTRQAPSLRLSCTA